MIIKLFLISGVLSPIKKGSEKLFSYELGIKPIRDPFTWVCRTFV